MRSRRSVRRFADRPVPREDLLRLFEAARWAPSNHNRQPWKFVVLERRDDIRALAAAVRQDLGPRLQALPAVAAPHGHDLLYYATFFEQAPVLVVALHKPPVSLAAPLLAATAQPALASGEPLSVAMAVQNLLLAAQALGLGSCVLTGPLLAPAALARVLGPTAGFEPTCLVALGWPDETPAPPRRKAFEQFVEFRNLTGK